MDRCERGKRSGRDRRGAAHVLRVLLAIVLAAAGTTHADGHRNAAQAGSAHERMARWLGLLVAPETSETDKLTAVQRFFAGFDQQDDETRWGVSDYWALPHEFVRVGAGDCEDFAIAKFATLIALGIPSDKLMLAQTHSYSAARQRIERHMVLAYRASASESPWILDNLTHAITRLDQRADLGPIASTPALRALELQLRQIGRTLAAIAAQGKTAPDAYAIEGPVPASLSSVRLASSPGRSGQ